MGRRKGSVPTAFAGREQTHLKTFLFKLYNDGCPPEEALRALRSRFDVDDFARARVSTAKVARLAASNAGDPRSKT